MRIVSKKTNVMIYVITVTELTRETSYEKSTIN